MVKVKIRKANKQDISDLVEILEDANALEDYFGKHKDKMLLKIMKQKDFVFLIAELDNKVVGFISFEIEKEAERIFLDVLAVHKNFRKMGIGTQLFEEMEKYLDKLKLKKLFFIVRDYTKEMNAMARKRGFKLSCKLNRWEKEYKK